MPHCAGFCRGKWQSRSKATARTLSSLGIGLITGTDRAFPEGAFLNHFVVPALHQFVSQYEGMDAP